MLVKAWLFSVFHRGGGSAPVAGYVAEDGVTPYVAEDGITPYVPES